MGSMKPAYFFTVLAIGFLLGSSIEADAQNVTKRETQWHRNQAKAARAGKGGLLSGLMERRKAVRSSKRAAVKAANAGQQQESPSANATAPVDDRTQKSNIRKGQPTGAQIPEAKGFTSGKNKRFRRRYSKEPLFGR